MLQSSIHAGTGERCDEEARKHLPCYGVGAKQRPWRHWRYRSRGDATSMGAAELQSSTHGCIGTSRVATMQHRWGQRSCKEAYMDALVLRERRRCSIHGGGAAAKRHPWMDWAAGPAAMQYQWGRRSCKEASMTIATTGAVAGVAL